MTLLTQSLIEKFRDDAEMSCAADGTVTYGHAVTLTAICNAAIVGLSEHRYADVHDYLKHNPAASVADIFEAGRELK